MNRPASWGLWVLVAFAPSPLRASVFQCPDGSPPPCRASSALAASANSVGVMLFSNLTHDTADAYLSDGLASEIASTLARVPRLEVRSPGAVRSAQRGDQNDPAVVGRRLNVRYVVEGDYQRGGSRIRITVRLVRVPAGTQRWSESYTRPASDLLAVQEEIAQSVATAIAGELLPQERRVLTASPTRNPEAYDHFLRGNHELARRTPAGVRTAIDEYGAALRLDSSLVPAEARIGLAYALFIDWGWDFPGVSVDSQLARGLRAVNAALDRDSASADAWMARAYLEVFVHPPSMAGVLEDFDRATRLDPNNAENWHQYGSWLVCAGRYEEGLAASYRAIALEPARPVSWINVGNAAEVRRRDREALAGYDSVVTIDPEFYAGYFFRTFVRLRLGDSAGARADAEAALRTSPPSERYYGLAAAAAVAAGSGDTAQAVRDLDEATAMFNTRPIGPLVAQTIATGDVAAGRKSQALDILQRARPLAATLWLALQFPEFDVLRGDPRFERLQGETQPTGLR